MKNVFFIRLLILAISLGSCSQKEKKEKKEKWHHVEISPIDDSQTITIITKGENRYIMNGKHDSIPLNNYLLLDLSEVDRLGDGISICWNEPGGFKWKIACSYASLVENKLDTTKYSFYQPTEKYDEPVSVNYKKKNCGNFLIREGRKPWGNLRVKYITK